MTDSFSPLTASEFSSLTEALLSIPSPSRNSIDLFGPLSIHAYGLMIGLGMLTGIAMAMRRWEARGGNGEQLVQVAIWGAVAGMFGARVYHVTTDWPTYAETGWINALKITNGGLGIPGGLLFGLIAGYIAAKRNKLHVPTLLDVALPGIAVAQAIGRLGNWFNQELFGRPTDLPWALEISAQARDNSSIPAEYLTAETFHPTFAYEGIWNLALAATLIYVTNRKLLKPGQSLFLWILGYGVGRFLVESIRIDPASDILGLRVNIWVSGFAVLVGLAGLAWMQRPSVDTSAPEPLIGDKLNDPAKSHDVQDDVQADEESDPDKYRWDDDLDEEDNHTTSTDEEE